MQAYTRGPAEIFGNHIRYVVPLFQRPYVWNKTDQWAPLWDDVAGVAEAVLTAPLNVFGAQPIPPHFLGAIVVEGHSAPVGFIAVKHVIDGQQRLTTLQLLLDAAPAEPDDATGEPLPTSTAEPAGVATMEEAEVAGHAGKYRALWRWLQDQSTDEISMSFSDVEDILGMRLPPSARNHLPHWYGYEGTALGRAIRDAGWRASGVNLTAERVAVVRATG